MGDNWQKICVQLSHVLKEITLMEQTYMKINLTFYLTNGVFDICAFIDVSGKFL